MDSYRKINRKKDRHIKRKSVVAVKDRCYANIITATPIKAHHDSHEKRGPYQHEHFRS